MAKLWFLTGIGETNVPVPEIQADVPGLKDWIESRIGIRPGWPDRIDAKYALNGEIELSIGLTFRLKDVDAVEALIAMSKRNH